MFGVYGSDDDAYVWILVICVLLCYQVNLLFINLITFFTKALTSYDRAQS